MPRIDLLGCPVDALSMEETVARIVALIEAGTPHRHATINAAKFAKMWKDKELFSIVTTSDLVSADGQAIVWAARFFGLPLRERVSGIDLMEALVALSSKSGYRLYFLGAREGVAKSMVESYKKRFPTLRVIGCRNGYFSEEEENLVVNDIRQSAPDILFVAMGTPKQEKWIFKHMRALRVPFVMGVGGSFDVAVGSVMRAPLWIQRAGLEWFFRFMQEPRRLWKRYLFGNISFCFIIIKEILRCSSKKRK